MCENPHHELLLLNEPQAEGEYHVYQTIPDRPEQSVQDNMVYSLLQAH